METLMNHEIKECRSERDWRRVWPVIQELRSHLSEDDYLTLLETMRKEEGYRLFYLEEAGEIMACAGIAVRTTFYYGKHVFVHELVTRSDQRSRGFGERLLAAVERWGQEQGCTRIALTSGLSRHKAHRFYEEKMGYGKKSYAFVKELGGGV
ncbi:GNAT family N-acetyltransferase [Salinithrix halophila]|uniref:GNAT family N-acetyltransferase n=1 Tax=Salinithrix halophila TaxID=1485204 RepID=A0ABV8JBH0_9BACL